MSLSAKASTFQLNHLVHNDVRGKKKKNSTAGGGQTFTNTALATGTN